MRGLKKLLTGIVAGALAFAMSFGAGNAVTAQAAEAGSITVSNTTANKEYNLYKVFDATYVEGSNNKVAYSYDGSNAAFLAALQDEANSPFTVSAYNGGYNVVRNASASDTQVTNFIKANEENFGDPVATEVGNGSALTFSGLGFGYYYITSELGTEVTITSAVPTQTVIDKNQATTIDKQESVDGGATWKYVKDEQVNGIPTQTVGNTVNYKLTGVVTQYSGTDKITFLKFTDTMSDGLTPDENVEVRVNDNLVDAQVEYNGQVTTIVLSTVDANGEFIYESNANYVITYSATVNTTGLTVDQNNEVVLTDNNNKELGKDKTEVTNYFVTLKKTDAADGTVLADAKFRFYATYEGEEEIPVVLVSGTGDASSEVDNVYRPAVGDEKGVEMVTGKTGIIVVKGLKNGDYYFEETAAPAGYNRITDRRAVSVIGNNEGAIVIENSTGSILPSTGGVGTTIFYVFGGILIIAGVAYFILRRKSQAE